MDVGEKIHGRSRGGDSCDAFMFRKSGRRSNLKQTLCLSAPKRDFSVEQLLNLDSPPTSKTGDAEERSQTKRKKTFKMTHNPLVKFCFVFISNHYLQRNAVKSV